MTRPLTAPWRVLPRVAAVGCALALAASFDVSHASACGGFFCDSSQPVNQQAERILFAHGADGGVTAIIQIQYSGPAERFAWVLPVAGSPAIGVSSDDAFARLQAMTNPQYVLTTRTEGTCRDDGRLSPSASGGRADGGAFASDGSVPPVTVVDQGSVGPYDYVVITVDPEAMPLAGVATEWLADNGYDISEASAELLQPYLAGGMNLLAFRLTKGNDAGSIRPVTIGFGPGLATIPIRPTAVAATDDMGVLVWVLGATRAVPANYMSLELNDAYINWLNPGSTYDAVVSAAADEAGGQGFVTEMAGPASPLADGIWSSFERDQWSALQATDWTGREGDMLQQVLATFGTLDGMRDALIGTVPLPMDVTRDELLACVSCYYGGATDIEGLEPAEFLAAVQTQAIAPMQSARELFEALPYVTRLYTTMSPAEMTRDPAFDFNPDLGDYDRLHTASRVIECSPSISLSDAPWRVELPSGPTVRGRGFAWPLTAGDGSMPANRRVLRVGTSGSGEVLEDNAATIGEALALHNTHVPGPPASGGCAIGGASSSAPLMGLLLALGVALVRRRRRA